MRFRLAGSSGASLVSALVLLPTDVTAQNQAPVIPVKAPAADAVLAPWGEPELQGSWTIESDTSLRRPAQGRGPNQATKDNATDFVGVEQDPFQ